MFAFNTITVVHESKLLVKHISCNCRSNFMVENVIQSKIIIMINVDVSVKKQQNIVRAKKIMLEILSYVLLSVTKILRLPNIQIITLS